MCATLVIGRASAAEPIVDTVVDSSRREADFHWFAGLDYPDLKGATPALVAIGGELDSITPEPPKNIYRLGFVLRSDRATFTVFYPNLTTVTHRRTPPGTPELLRRGFEPLSAAKLVEAYRDMVRRTHAGFLERMSRELDFRVYLDDETFVAAYCCSRLGFVKEAGELYRLAVEAHDNDGPVAADRPFSEGLRRGLAYTAMYNAMDALAYAAPTRAEAAAAFALVVKNFPTSEQAATAKQRVEILARMAQEDREHARRLKTMKPFARLSRQEQIAELIFRLRDQQGVHEPLGGYNPIDMDAKRKDTPGHKLVHYGLDAIPQLLEAMDDERICNITYGRVFPDGVITVGDCAYAVITEIAGRGFGYERGDPLDITDRQRIEAWYAEARLHEPPVEVSSSDGRRGPSRIRRIHPLRCWKLARR